MPRARKIIYLFLLLLGVFVLKGQMLLAGGAVYGRLAVPPVNDDVFYFVDALKGLQIFRDHGTLAWLSELVRYPPHAPYSYLAAFLAFLLTTGWNEGPYLLNAAAISLITLFLVLSFRYRRSTSLLISLILITFTWFDYTVTFFHPDLVAGYGAAVVAAVLLWQDWTLRKPAHALLAGAAAGFILLVKPVAVAMIAMVWILAILAGIATAGLDREALKASARRLLPGMLVAVLVAGPYFVSEIHVIADHFKRGFVTQRETWAFHSSAAGQAKFYPLLALEMFRNWLSFGGAVAALAIIVSLYRRNYGAALRFLAMSGLCVVAYAVPTLFDAKSLLFGGVFYGFIAVIIVLSAGQLLEWTRAANPPFGALGKPSHLILTLGIVCLAFLNFGDRQIRFSSDDIIDANNEYRTLYDFFRSSYALRVSTGRVNPLGLVAYFPSPVPVAPYAFEFRALRENLPLSVIADAHQAQAAVVTAVARAANIVVIPDDRLLLSSRYPFAVNKILPELRNWIEHAPQFSHVAQIRLMRGNLDIYSDIPVPPEQ